MKKKIKRILSLIIASTFLGMMAGCADSGDTAATQTGGDSSQTASADLPEVVNIGTMNLVNGDLIAQYEKLYEQELGVNVNIQNFDSGRDVNTAIAAGSIDISQVGTSPTALGLSSDIPYEVIWLADVIGSAESLVVKNDAGVSDIQGLKGKTVATPFASTAHYSLLNALKDAGIDESE
ncbi:MAG: ABC transporter substrate-binding protein, partial [Firmicutes bacterium]|nr:ABC transporter substrate-binding protein [Bacillota bacterium]